jgi:hypothetical protein
MDEQKKQLVEKLKSANNILVTVRSNPSVDLLSACIGLTVMLNKLGKHASAVFSGEVPSTMEFLKPEETLEKDTNSLRDFIIALDKSKADKLRYKVEDKTVRIFITPFKTSLSQSDLEFSQGDFNVDVVLALGAHEQHELDQAITEHGRILHDAAVMSINNRDDGNLGGINWQNNGASSISEMVAQLSGDLGKDLLDEQVATALLTGIVAETDRFSNDKTSSETMSISAQLMTAGANQQLVAAKLEEAVVADIQTPQNSDGNNQPDNNSGDQPPKQDDGTLEIEHEGDKPHTEATSADNTPESAPPNPDTLTHGKTIEPPTEAEAPYKPPLDPLEGLLPPKEEDSTPPEIKQLHSHDLLPPVPEIPSSEVGDMTGIGFSEDKPSGTASPITANIQEEPLDGALDPLGPVHAGSQPLLSHDHPAEDEATDQPPAVTDSPQPSVSLPPAPEPPAPTFTPVEEPTAPQPTDENGKTLSEIEQDVHSPHAGAGQPAAVSAGSPPAGDIDTARDEVLKALQDAPAQPAEPIVALGAQPLGADLHPQPEAPAPGAGNTDLHLDADGNLQLPQLPPTPPAPSQPVNPVAPPMPAVNEPAPSPMSPADQPMDMPLPPTSGIQSSSPSAGLQIPPPQSTPPTNAGQAGPGAPPPVPPPMLPPLPGQ